MTTAAAESFSSPSWPPRAPDDTGACGQAWRSRFEPGPENPPDWGASLAQWAVTTREGQYVVNLIHLRDIPGVRPAKIVVPGATHELLVGIPELFVHVPDHPARLGLLLATVQVNQPSDAEAQKLAHYVVHRMIGHGDHPVLVVMAIAKGVVRPACTGEPS